MIGAPWRKGIIAAVSMVASQRGTAAEQVIQTEPLATRIVIVSPAELTDRAGVAAVHRQLRIAAKAVCDEQYPREVFYFAWACYSGAYRDAADQLKRISSHKLNAQPNIGRRMAIAVSAR